MSLLRWAAVAPQAGPGAPRDLWTTQANSHQELKVAAEKVSLVEGDGGGGVERYLDTYRGLITPSLVARVRVSDVKT